MWPAASLRTLGGREEPETALDVALLRQMLLANFALELKRRGVSGVWGGLYILPGVGCFCSCQKDVFSLARMGCFFHVMEGCLRFFLSAFFFGRCIVL